jgi:tetratricopeptide (TPR) repeat protein
MKIPLNSGTEIICNTSPELIPGEETPMSVGKLLRKALVQHESCDYEGAATLYREILTKKPNHLDANYLLGTLYAECGDFERAKRHLLKASIVNPDSPMVQVNLGNVHRMLGAPELAVASFKRAINLLPTMFQAQLGLGSTLLALGSDLDLARECLERALSLAPDVAEIHHQMGMLLAQEGRVEEALQQLELTRCLSPEFPGIDKDLEMIGEGKQAAAGESCQEQISEPDSKEGEPDVAAH